MWLTWLPAVLRDAGLTVIEHPGWQVRGHGEMQPIRGVLLHHTAGPSAGQFPSLATVRDGRPGLAGPLAQLGLGRDGVWQVIAAGLAWHAGAGVLPWCPKDRGNNFLIGVEAESTGKGDWTPAQLDAYPRGVAAILAFLHLDASRAAGHKEYAPTRKIDPAGWPGDMTGFRAAVAQHLAGQETDMATGQDVITALQALYDDRSGGHRNMFDSLVQILNNQWLIIDLLNGIRTGNVDEAALAKALSDNLAARLKD